MTVASGPVKQRDRSNNVSRVVAWNLALLATGPVLIAGVGEGWLRLTVPFAASSVTTHFVPGVGWMLSPDTEIRYTRHFDFWTVSRTNSLGFLDREPIRPARAAEGCHVAVIGDSFVAAREVPVADKFHVRLEEMAGRELPRLGVTTSAFGRAATGQINQLPFYDEFARPLEPRLLVLVFVANDFDDNYPIFSEDYLIDGREPYMSARRSEDGSIELLPPEPNLRHGPGRPSNSRPRAFISRVRSESYFGRWLTSRIGLFDRTRLRPEPAEQRDTEGTSRVVDLLGSFRERWSGGMRFRDDIALISAVLTDDSPRSGETLAFTAFGLDEFRKRADRDGVSLVILATHSLGTRGDVLFDRVSALAEARDIPVVDQHDYIRRRGGLVREAYWEHDYHWNPQGHRWAAESLLEYIAMNPDVCGGDEAPAGR